MLVSPQVQNDFCWINSNSAFPEFLQKFPYRYKKEETNIISTNQIHDDNFMAELTQNIKQSELEIPTRTSIHGLSQQLIQTETWQIVWMYDTFLKVRIEPIISHKTKSLFFLLPLWSYSVRG